MSRTAEDATTGGNDDLAISRKTLVTRSRRFRRTVPWTLLFVLVDAFSKWVEVVPVTSPSAVVTINCLRNIFATHGIPDLLVSDNGPAFVSAEFREFLRRNGIKQILIPPYHPASNGAAERVVQTVKAKLKKSVKGDFQSQVARLLLHYRTQPHAVTGCTPAELLMGRRLRTALDLLQPQLRQNVVYNQLKQKLWHDKRARCSVNPAAGDMVYARNFRPGPTWVRGQVTDAVSSSSVQLQLADGIQQHRHVDHLRRRRSIQQSTSATSDDRLTVSSPDAESPAVGSTDLGSTELPEDQAGSVSSPSTSDRRVETPAEPPPTHGCAQEGSPIRPLRRSTRTRKPIERYVP